MKNGRENLLENCMLCPRACGINRLNGCVGYCGAGAEVRLARAALHFWEEPCISGTKGSGTVFFSHCSLGCVYCQNAQISSGMAGQAVSVDRLAAIFLELQEKGSHNINLVTADHYLPQILEALSAAKKSGLVIPVAYNCSGWQTEESIRMLQGFADIYLTDFKYMDGIAAKRYSNAPGYAAIAKKAVARMAGLAGRPVFDADGIMQKGVIVRHLALPGLTQDSKAIIRYLHETFGDTVCLSIMSQYTPMGAGDAYPELARKITKEEYDELIDFAESIGVEDAYIQEGEAASESFIPPFDYEGVLK